MRKIFLDLKSAEGIGFDPRRGTTQALWNTTSTTAKLLRPTLHRSIVHGTFILCRNGTSAAPDKYFSRTYFGYDKPPNWRQHTQA